MMGSEEDDARINNHQKGDKWYKKYRRDTGWNTVSHPLRDRQQPTRLRDFAYVTDVRHSTNPIVKGVCRVAKTMRLC
jgi:hypothetical protein